MDEHIMTGSNKTLQQLLDETLHGIWYEHLIETIALMAAMEARFGPAVLDVAEEIIGKKIRQEWANIAEEYGSNSIEDLILLLWDPLRTKGFSFTTVPRDNGMQVFCTRCPLLSLKEKVASDTWLYHLTCGKDFHIVKGFNPQIRLHRTKTLLQGDDCCDHFYFIENMNKIDMHADNR